MLYADGKDADLIEGLAAQTGHDVQTVLRQALAVYGYLLDARANGASLFVREPDGGVVEVLVNFVDDDGRSGGVL